MAAMSKFEGMTADAIIQALKERGIKAGKARAAALTPERRKAIARKAAKARWKRKADKPEPPKP